MAIELRVCQVEDVTFADNERGAAVELVECGGRRMAYHRAGAGPSLVLLHGGWSDGRAWRPQLAGLADAFDVIAWGAPGCGGSDDPPDRMALTDYADAVADLVATLGIERLHLGGLSFGGALAIAVYRRLPRRCGRSSWRGPTPAGGGRCPPAEVEGRLRRARAEADRPPLEWMDGYLPTFFSGPVPPEVAELVRTMMFEVRSAGLLPMLTALAEADLRDVLPTIAVPTLLLYGEPDVRSPLPVADALHAGIPGSELVVLPGVGHCVNLAAPEAFDAEVRRFLGAVS